MGFFGRRGAVLRRAMVLAVGGLLASAAIAAAVADETPRRGGVLTYPMPLGDPDTFDCHASQSIVALTRLAPHYSTLVRLDPATYPAISPDAARSWEVSPDGLTYTFHLAPDIPFHDGTKLTSADVKATYDRLRNPPAGVVSMRQQQFRDIATIETPDPTTVVFHLSKINPAMLTVFASPWNCLYSAKKLAEDPKYPASEVMGSGPFRFAEYVPGSFWRGERFENYFQKGLPYLDGFKVVNMTSQTIGNALIACQINFDIFGLSIQDQQRVAAARGATVKKYGPMSVLILSQLRVNTERPPLNDIRVRQAMSLAIDRWTGEKVLPRVMFTAPTAGGFQRPGSPLAPPTEELHKMLGYGPDIAANRAEAKRLLAEAGATNLKVTFTNIASYTALGIYLIDQWRQIGVEVTQEMVPNSQWLHRRATGDFQMIFDTSSDFVDEPTIQMDKFLSFDVNPTNTTHMIDHRIDQLYEQQARMPDLKQRAAIVWQLDNQLHQDAATLPLLWSGRTVYADANLRGLDLVPSEFIGLDWRGVWFAK
jgi:peptide/nickel transport system substrate-binding protein